MDNPQLSPEVPKQSPGGPFGGGPPPEPKGDLRPLLDLVGIDWPTTEIVWNTYNPHPQLADLPPEIVFIGRGSGAEDAFNPDQIISSGLQEVVMLFPGLLRSKAGSGPEFTPLLTTNASGGTLSWRDVARQNFLGMTTFNPERPHFPTGQAYTLAARLQGRPGPEADEAPKKEAEKKDDAKKADVHVIAIADLDVISEQFFELRRRRVEGLEFDNVTFVLNCVDVLAGDDAFVGLRKRRLQHRTLLLLEEQTKRFAEQRQAQAKAAEDAAQEQLESAQKRLNQQVEAVRARTDLDEQSKAIMLGKLQEVANRRLAVEEANIKDQKRQEGPGEQGGNGETDPPDPEPGPLPGDRHPPAAGAGAGPLRLRGPPTPRESGGQPEPDRPLK